MHFKVQNDRAGNARWWLYAENEKLVAYSGEPFASLANAKRAADSFRVNAAHSNYEVYPDDANQFRWRARSTGNHEIIAVSGESFADKWSAERAAHNVRDHAGKATP